VVVNGGAAPNSCFAACQFCGENLGRSVGPLPTDRPRLRPRPSDPLPRVLEKTPYLPTIGGACQHRDNPYLPTPATLTYHKRKVCRRFGDRHTFSLPGLAAVSLSGASGAVSVNR